MPKPWPTTPLQCICKESIKSYRINFDVICLENFDQHQSLDTDTFPQASSTRSVKHQRDIQTVSNRNLNNSDATDSPLNRVWGGNAQAMTNNSFATHLWRVHQVISYQLCLEHFEYFHGAPTCAKCHLLHSFMCSCPANKLTCDSAFPLHTNGSLWQHD